MRCGFGDVLIDTDRFVLERDGAALHVEPQVFDVLAYLVEHRDRVVPKVELLDNVWGDRFVSESALTSRIKSARRIIGDDGSAQSMIRTVHGRGYRFVADVETVGEGEARTAPLATTDDDLEQHIRFCRTSDGVRIGYATVGDGPPLVRAAHWLTHLDDDWRSPVWRHWLTDLSRGRTLVRYDERGCGLSDHEPGDFSLDAFVHDLETVVDDLGLDRFPLMGLSQGGPVAITYALRHPERVSHLVLVGAYVRGRVVRADTDELRRANELEREMIQLGWGLDEPSFRLYFSSTFMPAADPELWSEFARLMRRTTSAESALHIRDACAVVDVTDAAAALDVPTLVLHARDELRIPFDEAKELAALIPGSRLVPLPSRNHLLRPDEPAWSQLLAELDAFLGVGAPS